MKVPHISAVRAKRSKSSNNLRAAAASLLLLVGCGESRHPSGDVSEDAPYAPKGPVERKYMAAGPWTVTEGITEEPCNRKGTPCDLYYPAELGANPLLGVGSGFRHPVIAWANGSGQQSERYSYFLRHLASWGFIVVAARDTMTAGGGTTIDAANYIIEQGQVAGSVFHDKVDADRVGAAGHSQGGGSAVALFSQQQQPFTAFVAIHPAPHFFAILVNGVRPSCILPSVDVAGSINLPEICLPLPSDFETATDGAILYINSVGDGGAGDTQLYYDETSDAATKAIGIVAQANHDDIMGTPACRPDANCITGAYAYLGYSTAWFMWKLQESPDGPEAFHAQTGDFNLASPDWQYNISNVR